MSYSNYARAVNTYRERDVFTASPARLVVMVYDHVVANLQRARVARDAKRPDVQLEAIGKARDGITELLVTLDLEKGGQIAADLQQLYTYMLTQLVDGPRLDARVFDRILAMVGDLRESFATIAGEPAKAPAA